MASSPAISFNPQTPLQLPFPIEPDQKKSSWLSFFSKKNELSVDTFNKKVLSGIQILKSIPPQKEELSLDFYESVVTNVKLFLTQNKKFSSEKFYKDCQKELLAFRLYIPSSALDEAVNPGFSEFAEKNHLYNSLLTHNQKLQVDLDTHKIKILHKEKYIPWSSNDGKKTSATKLIESFKADQIQHPLEEPTSTSYYGRKGLQFKDRYHWTTLKPLLKGETKDWSSHFIKDPLLFDANNKAYLMEICSSATEASPRILAGDHTWIRLYEFEKTDEKILGIMYSIGLYRPKKMHFYFDNFYKPFRIKKGYLTNDISEVWGINREIRTVAKRISFEDYDKIKQKISVDKQKDELIFHLFKHNCDRYVHELIKLAGVNLPTKTHFFRLFTVIHLEANWQQKLTNCSTSIKRIAWVIVQTFKIFTSLMTPFLMTPFFNLFFFILGSGFIDEAFKNNKKIRPLIDSFSAFFDSENLYCYAPWVLAHPVKAEIEKWRKEENKKYPSKKEEIAYQFPPHYLTLTPKA